MDYLEKKLDRIKKEVKLKETELEFVNRLKLDLHLYKNIAIQARNDYLLVMKDEFNKNRREETFSPGDLVVYFIGDRNVILRKLRAKWSGPWIIIKHVSANTCEIKDPRSDVRANVHVERLKIYRKREFYTWKKHEELVNNGELSQEIDMTGIHDDDDIDDDDRVMNRLWF